MVLIDKKLHINEGKELCYMLNHYFTAMTIKPNRECLEG